MAPTTNRLSLTHILLSVAVPLGAFTMYMQPDFMVPLAQQALACF